ncbi:MAG: class I SAM-dependent methyltransferase [Clostridia bacterium]|nr:class I SAM-dependent methyltransferase [Clostridia bacterium]
MRIKLDKRLSRCLSLIEGESLCDVGTDHGKLPVAALLEGKVKRAIAIDISEKSLMKAKVLAEETGVTLSCRAGDGLKPLGSERVDVCVIAGMGGREIVKILSETPSAAKRYLLVPHTDAPLVRAFLKEKNIGIVSDEIVKDSGKFYPVIQADPSLPWNETHNLYFRAGGPDAEEYRSLRLKKIESILSFKDDAALEEEKEILQCRP